MSKKSILIVDDEQNIRRILQVAFEKAGYQVAVAEDGREAMDNLSHGQIDCVLTDVTMPGITGYDLLRQIKDQHPATPVVIMTAFGTIPQAVQAVRDGAFEYLTKPFDLEALKKVVAAAVEDGSNGVSAKKGRAKPAPAGKAFIAESEAMQEVLETIKQVADSRATILITGESGVGKEVVAKSLHEMSSRASKSFVAVSCAALPETLLESELFGYEKGAFTGAQGAKAGKFEMAHGGSLFLDEIGEVPLPIQIKLLRVLQEREFERLGATKPTQVDVRLITATNRDLHQAVEEGIFRLDLLYRLQVVEIHIPALRERVADIKPLSEHFLRKYAADNGREPLEVTPEALAILQRYSWPGNVRELENTMERATVLSPSSQRALDAKLLPASLLKAA